MIFPKPLIIEREPYLVYHYIKFKEVIQSDYYKCHSNPISQIVLLKSYEIKKGATAR